METHRAPPHPPAADAAPADAGGVGAAGRAGPGGLRRRRPAAPRRGHRPRDPARARGGSRPTEALALAPGLRRPACAAACSSWDGQLEDDARLVTTIARTAAGLGAERPHPGPRRRATGTRGVTIVDEPHRRDHGTWPPAAVVNATGVWADGLVRGDHAAAQPRHPPGAARRLAARPADRGHRAGAGLDQPVRDGAPPARRHRLRRAHRRAGRRPGARRAGADRARDRVPARRRVGGVRPRRCAAPTWSAPTPGCGRCSTTPPAATADLSRRHAVLTSRERRGDRGRRQADDLPPDGRGRRRPRRRRAAGSTPTRCRTRSLPLAGAAPRHELAAAGAAAPAGTPLRHRRRRWCSTSPASVTGLRTTRRCWPRSPPDVPGHPGRAGLRRHPRGCRRRRRPARPAYPGRPGGRRPRRSPSPPPSGPWRWWRRRRRGSPVTDDPSDARVRGHSSLDYPKSLHADR